METNCTYPPTAMSSNTCYIEDEVELKLDFPKNGGDYNKYVQRLMNIKNELGTSIEIVVHVRGNHNQVEDAQKLISEIEYSLDSDKANLATSEELKVIQKTLLEIQNKMSSSEAEISETTKKIHDMVDAMKENKPDLKQTSIDVKKEECTFANDNDMYKFVISKNYRKHILSYPDDKELHIASALGRLDVVRTLMKNGDYVNMRASSGATPLYRASSAGHLNVVKFLIGRGAYIDAKTALFIATVNREKPIVEYLCSQKPSRHMMFTPQKSCCEQCTPLNCDCTHLFPCNADISLIIRN